jgi:tRNA A58 N-methylase Trm61
MKLSPGKVVLRVEQLQIALRQARREKKEFKGIHQDILDLCRVVYNDRKVHYATIDLPYPEEVIIRIHNHPSKKVEEINATPQIEDEKSALAKELDGALKRIHRLYSLKKRLEVDEESIIGHLKAIRKELAEIKRDLKP